MKVSEIISILRNIRQNLREETEHGNTAQGLEDILTANDIPLFTKTLEMTISFSVNANALTAVNEIRTRVQNGETEGELVSGIYAYEFYLDELS